MLARSTARALTRAMSNARARGGGEWSGNTRSRTRARASERESRELELRNLWASSYDCWMNVPNETNAVVYMRPRAHEEDEGNGRDCPKIARTMGAFAVTGHNPMGKIVDKATNDAANERLGRDLRALNPLAMWEAYGFSDGWREDGFVCAFADAERGLVDVLRIARAYGQGAIYAYEALDAAGERGRAKALVRKTVPAAMGDIVSDQVVMVVCEEPKFQPS